MAATSPRVRSTVVSICIALLLALVGAPVARALPDGGVDAGFGVGGIQINGFGTDDWVNAVARQSDGKIVAVGFTDVDGTGDFLVLRYTAAGALDTTFDGDGKAVTAIGTASDEALAVAIQADQKIVVAGYSGDAEDVIAIARYNANGSLDTSFSIDGKDTLSIGGVQAYATALLIQSDGKIVVAGYAYDGVDGEYEFALVRYNTDGSLDTSFDSDGITTHSVGSGVAFAAALQSDGKIVVAGYSGAGATDDFAIVRFNTDGSVDTDFGTDGLATVDFGDDDYANAVAIHSGKIVVVGTVYVDSNSLVGIVRLTSDGSMDTTFDTDGKRTDAWDAGGGSDEAYGTAIQTDGKIIVVGSVYHSDSGRDLAVARYNTSGSRDTTFASGGLAAPEIELATDAAQAVLILPDTKIVVGGYSAGDTYDALVARFNGDATAPTGARMTNVPRYSLAKTRTMTWTSSDVWSGVKSHDVQRRGAKYNATGYGSWSTVFANRVAKSGNVTGNPGYTYCFRTRARDVAGNLSAYSSSSCMAIPLDERSMTAAGSWSKLSSSSYYLGTAMRSTAAGATLRIKAAWRHLAVVVTKCSTCGTLKVYRGSTLLKTINLSSSSTAHKRVITVSSSSSVLSGTITLRQSSGGKKVIVDGLAVSLA